MGILWPLLWMGAGWISVNVLGRPQNNLYFVLWVIKLHVHIRVCVNVSLSLFRSSISYFCLFNLSVSERNVLDVVLYGCWFFSLLIRSVVAPHICFFGFWWPWLLCARLKLLLLFAYLNFHASYSVVLHSLFLVLLFREGIPVIKLFVSGISWFLSCIEVIV